jgi:hypothetical protein
MRNACWKHRVGWATWCFGVGWRLEEITYGSIGYHIGEEQVLVKIYEIQLVHNSSRCIKRYACCNIRLSMLPFFV